MKTLIACTALLLCLVPFPIAAQTVTYADVTYTCGPGTEGTPPFCKSFWQEDDGYPDDLDTAKWNGEGGAAPTLETPTTTAPPCATGNDAIDSEGFADGSQKLWDDSDLEKHLYDRHEQAGWIVLQADGTYRIDSWNLNAPYTGICGAGLPMPPFPPEGPGAIVGFIHTHPYSVGEFIKDCNGNPQQYMGIPSPEDRQTYEALRNALGHDLLAVLIDGTNITTFNGALGLQYPRCGYRTR